MKIILVILGLILLTVGSIKIKPKIDPKLQCQRYCGRRGLLCVGNIDRTVYDGSLETDEILKHDKFIICTPFPSKNPLQISGT